MIGVGPSGSVTTLGETLRAEDKPDEEEEKYCGVKAVLVLSNRVVATMVLDVMVMVMGGCALCELRVES